MTVRTFAGEGTGKRPAVCMYSMHLVNLYRERPVGSVGGAEVQYHLLARELAKDHDVHIVTLAPVPADRVVPPPGIVLHTLDVPRGRSRVLWFLRVTMGQWRALSKADAKAVLQRAAGVATFIVALWCKVHRRPFVYHWASDANIDGPRTGEGVELTSLFLLGRRWARVQVCQTEHQRRLLPPAERDRAVVIPNVLDDAIPWRVADGGADVLWVGTIRNVAKRPDLFLDLAESLPGRSFRMVGELRGPKEFTDGFRQRLARLPNVTFVGFVRRTDLPAHFAAARCLVNTSDYEGFPNTFLEACASGVPVVSLNVDPDGLLARRGAGRLAGGDRGRLRAGVEAMFDDGVWRPCREAALVAVRDHLPAAAADRLRAVLREIGDPARPVATGTA